MALLDDLQKGLIDPRQSLDEISSGQTVIINDISTYRQVQYRELAEKVIAHAKAAEVQEG